MSSETAATPSGVHAHRIDGGAQLQTNRARLSFSRIRPHFNQTRFEKSQQWPSASSHNHHIKSWPVTNPSLRVAIIRAAPNQQAHAGGC